MLLQFLSLLFVIFLPFYVSAESIEENPQLQNHCKRISNKLASVSYEECLSHKFEMADGYSVKGSPILVKNYFTASNENGSYKNIKDETTNKRILLIGGIHGNEYSSISIIFKWITILNQYHTDSYHWQIVPLLNPDGLLQKLSKRVNANGIDLDRNFSVNADAGEDQDSQYGEENSLWEPESLWLAEEIKRYRPDAIITVHAPNSSHAYKLLNNYQPELGAQYQNTIATFPGSFNQYVGARIDIPILTVELPYADVMPTKSEINEIWENLNKWLNEHL
jgi:hypothetical protein